MYDKRVSIGSASQASQMEDLSTTLSEADAMSSMGRNEDSETSSSQRILKVSSKSTA